MRNNIVRYWYREGNEGSCVFLKCHRFHSELPLKCSGHAVFIRRLRLQQWQECRRTACVDHASMPGNHHHHIRRWRRNSTGARCMLYHAQTGNTPAAPTDCPAPWHFSTARRRISGGHDLWRSLCVHVYVCCPTYFPRSKLMSACFPVSC